MSECYIRGITIKYIRIPDEVIDMMKDDLVMKTKARGDVRPGRNAPGQRGRNTPRGNLKLLNVWRKLFSKLIKIKFNEILKIKNILIYHITM